MSADAGQTAEHPPLHSEHPPLHSEAPASSAAGPAPYRGGRARDEARLTRVRRRDIVTVVVLGLLQAAGLVAFVLLIGRIVEVLLPTTVGRAADEEYHRGLVTAGLLAVVAVALGVLRAWEFTVAERAGYLVVQRLRMAMYVHLQRMMPHHLRHRARGGLLLRLTGDLSMLRMWASRGLLEGISATIVLVTGLGLIGHLDPLMGCALVAGLSAGAVASLLNGRAMREATRSMRRRRSLLIGNIDEQINALAVTQAHGRVAGERARLDRQNASLTRSLIRVARLRGRLRGLAVASGLLATVGVLAVGLVQTRRGQATVPEVVAALVVARLLTRPTRVLGLAHDYWHRGLVSRQKVLDFLASSSRHPVEERFDRLAVGRGAIELRGLGVTGLVEGVTASVEGGRLVGLTGGAGTGASTLLDVLARLVDPTAGTVLVDGQDLTFTAPFSAGRRVGYASPGLPLMRGSLMRNLTYAGRGADPAEVQRVVLALGLDETMQRAGGAGVQAWLTEGGANLAASDRALVALGRALMGNPPVLLLDDPLAALDDTARPRARSAILRHRGTVLWASPNDNDLELADTVWVMRAGRLVECLSGDEFRARRAAEPARRSLAWAR